MKKKFPPMTNKQDKCECGSGYMPTIMEQDRNRWACRVCYLQNVETIRQLNAGSLSATARNEKIIR